MECAELKGIPNLNKFPVKDFFRPFRKIKTELDHTESRGKKYYFAA